MQIEYIEKNIKVCDDDIIADLIGVAKQINKSALTISDYENHGKYNSTTIMRHFGTWNHALELAGLQISNKQYSLEELYDNLADIWMKLGKQPSRRDLNKIGSEISYKAYERKFGKWSTALKMFVEHYNSTIAVQASGSNIEEKVNSSHTTSRDINLRMRYHVMKRDNFKCCKCGASPATDHSVELHIDHIIPWSKGGETILDNLQTLCSKCNLGKSNLTEE